MSSSIFENIILGTEGNQEHLKSALQQACFDKEVSEMEDGLNTICFDKGANLSGGQRARLNLARVFYQKKSFLLLDDPLKALDPESQKLILLNLKSLESTRIVTSSNP